VTFTLINLTMMVFLRDVSPIFPQVFWKFD